MPEHRTYGLPDIELPGAKGATVNPANFAGHDMVVLFCPAARQAAAGELAAYNSLAERLAFNEAYMIAVCDPEAGAPASRILLATDPEQRAWKAFGECVGKNERPSPGEGAVYLFGRGGCLRRIWQGTGHADEVMHWLGERM
jgi:peroxiredoxin